MVNFIEKLTEKLADWFMVFFTDPEYTLQPVFASAGSTSINADSYSERNVINSTAVRKSLLELNSIVVTVNKVCIYVFEKVSSSMQKRQRDKIQYLTSIAGARYNAMPELITGNLIRISGATGEIVEQMIRRTRKKISNVRPIKHIISFRHLSISVFGGLFLQGQST